MAPRAIKGLMGTDAPVAQFVAFQAMAITPVQWEMHLEVGFDGFVADVAPLRAALSQDLLVTKQLQGLVMFSRVSRAGKHIWEKSPEQVVFPGSKLISGWQGVRDALFQLSIRGRDFVLLQDTMHNLKSPEDLGLLRMNRTYCKDHLVEVVTFPIMTSNVSYSLLKKKPSLLAAFIAAIQKVFVLELGCQVSDAVQLEVSCGPTENTVSIKSTIVPPSTLTAVALQSKVKDSSSLAQAVAAAIVNIRGSETACRIGVDVSQIGFPKVVAVKADSLGECGSECCNRPCRNCKGVLRLRFAAPDRYAERQAQLQSLSNEELGHRAQLCGLGAIALAGAQRKETTNLILKCEKIIR
jgi:hypothetical protein